VRTGNREDWHTIPVAIEEAVDEMKIARSAATGAHGDLSGEMGFRTGSKRGYFFMPHVHPLNLLTLSDDVGQPIQ
jgi:hypothetical protein